MPSNPADRFACWRHLYATAWALRHLETVVKPWLTANARWALQENRLLLGIFEDLREQTEWDLRQVVEDALGGFWEKSLSQWEGRRDGCLISSARATPGLFCPALQIDPIEARLLIEALSGRWSYGNERRDKRNIWFHVANAFSLLASSMEPAPASDKIKVLCNSDLSASMEVKRSHLDT